MQYVGKFQLMDELEQDREYSCGPAGTDHDWEVFFATGHHLHFGDKFADVEEALTEFEDSYGECTWCGAIIDPSTTSNFSTTQK